MGFIWTEILSFKSKVLERLREANVPLYFCRRVEIVCWDISSKIVPRICFPCIKRLTVDYFRNRRVYGLYLDRQLSFKSNVLERLRGTNVPLYFCRRAVRVRWDHSSKIVLRVYAAFVHKVIVEECPENIIL